MTATADGGDELANGCHARYDFRSDVDVSDRSDNECSATEDAVEMPMRNGFWGRRSDEEFAAAEMSTRPTSNGRERCNETNCRRIRRPSVEASRKLPIMRCDCNDDSMSTGDNLHTCKDNNNSRCKGQMTKSQLKDIVTLPEPFRMDRAMTSSMISGSEFSASLMAQRYVRGDVMDGIRAVIGSAETLEEKQRKLNAMIVQLQSIKDNLSAQSSTGKVTFSY